jgi:hypothetical protein
MNEIKTNFHTPLALSQSFPESNLESIPLRCLCQRSGEDLRLFSDKLAGCVVRIGDIAAIRGHALLKRRIRR